MAGLEHRYEVRKISNPAKQLDCIVLEFDDPIARVAIECWALEMLDRGYTEVYDDVMEKLKSYE